MQPTSEQTNNKGLYIFVLKLVWKSHPHLIIFISIKRKMKKKKSYHYSWCYFGFLFCRKIYSVIWTLLHTFIIIITILRMIFFHFWFSFVRMTQSSMNGNRIMLYFFFLFLFPPLVTVPKRFTVFLFFVFLFYFLSAGNRKNLILFHCIEYYSWEFYSIEENQQWKIIT